MNSGFTLVGTLGVSTISKFDGGFGWSNIKAVRVMGVMCEEAPLSRIQSCSRMELVEAAAMKAQLYESWCEEESEGDDLCFDFLDDFLW